MDKDSLRLAFDILEDMERQLEADKYHVVRERIMFLKGMMAGFASDKEVLKDILGDPDAAK